MKLDITEKEFEKMVEEIFTRHNKPSKRFEMIFY